MVMSDNFKRVLPTFVVLAALFLSLSPIKAVAQFPEPQREQLLNGLKILLISRPGDPNVLLKLRIHSGSAFDTAGKVGTMSLLADSLFPDPLTFDYFKDEINGRLEVDTDIDAIDITLVGRATEYDRIVDTLRGALVTTPLSPENVTKVREAKIKKLSEHRLSPEDLANQRIAARLFGSFPYANDPNGTVESLSRIDRADLMLARDRFLSPNNATLVIIGGVDQTKAMRALRQLLGGWRKADELVPASFRQPAPADPRTLIANFEGTETSEVRLAVRGLARGDRDSLTASLLAIVAKNRWQKLIPDAKVFVRHEAHTLPGIFSMGASVGSNAVPKTLESARSVIKSLTGVPATAEEIDRAKAEYLSNEAKLSGDDRLANTLLNIETYTLPSISDQQRTWNAISAADLQRVASRLFSNATTASVVVGNVDTLKAQLPAANTEVLGEAQMKAAEPAPTPATTQPTKHRTFVFTPKTTSPLIKSQKPHPQP